MFSRGAFLRRMAVLAYLDTLAELKIGQGGLNELHPISNSLINMIKDYHEQI